MILETVGGARLGSKNGVATLRTVCQEVGCVHNRTKMMTTFGNSECFFLSRSRTSIEALSVIKSYITSKLSQKVLGVEYQCPEEKEKLTNVTNRAFPDLWQF